MSALWTTLLSFSPPLPSSPKVTRVCCAWEVTDITKPLVDVDGKKWTSLPTSPGFRDNSGFTVLIEGAENRTAGRGRSSLNATVILEPWPYYKAAEASWWRVPVSEQMWMCNWLSLSRESRIWLSRSHFVLSWQAKIRCLKNKIDNMSGESGDSQCLLSCDHLTPVAMIVGLEYSVL